MSPTQGRSIVFYYFNKFIIFNVRNVSPEDIATLWGMRVIRVIRAIRVIKLINKV